MKLALRQERSAVADGGRRRVRRTGDNLALIEPMGPVAPVVEWPWRTGKDGRRAGVGSTPITHLSPSGGAADAVEVRAEIRAKRFGEGAVEQDRYGATVTAAAASPYAMLVALVDALGAAAEFRRAAAPGEQVILEVTLRR